MKCEKVKEKKEVKKKLLDLRIRLMRNPESRLKIRTNEKS